MQTAKDQPDPRKYQEPRQFLQDTLNFKKKHNPSFSARAWASKMGFGNHSLLSMLLSGTREIRPSHLKKLLKGLDLTAEEQEYFECLILLRGASTDYEREVHIHKLRQLSSNDPLSFLDVEKFRAISNWIHFAILEMTELRGFQADPSWIAKRLGNKVTATQVHSAIERLVRLGLLRREKKTLVKAHTRLHTGDAQSSKAIREYHTQVLELAAKAVEEQALEERILHTFCFTVDTAKLPEAQKIIHEFRKKLSKVCGKSQGNETYQCAVQLFKLTKKINEGNEDEK